MSKNPYQCFGVEVKVPLSNLSNQEKTILPTAFSREYEVLKEVCASMRSGFLLLNQSEDITYSNQSALRLLQLADNGYTPQKFNLRERLISLAADPSLVGSELERLWRVDSEERSADLALADAAVRWLRVRCFPVHDRSGRLLGRGLLLDDVTLERSALENRAETLALAAHELKTPLAVIKGCATTLLGASVRWDPALQREMLQMIDTQSDRLYEILNTLLDVWRFDAGSPQLHIAQVSIADLLQQSLQRWQGTTPDRAFRLSLPPSLAMVLCDAIRIEQVLDHLLRNAVNYSSAGSMITIHVEEQQTELCLKVIDQGCGLAEEHLERVFERFFRVQAEEKGSGLGLSAVRATIEAHKGKVWAESAGLGLGATFLFTLPLASQLFSHTVSSTGITAPLEQLPASSRVLLKTDRRVHVLLAESDARLTRYLRAHLEEQQYRVQSVTHGLQFLKQIDLEEPDLILLSSRLSDMSGVDLLQRLREFSQTPVILLTDECDEDTRVQLFDLGCDDLIAKPFGIKEFLARVRARVRRQQSQPVESPQKRHFSTGELSIDYAQHLVTLHGQAVQLSRTEYRLLSILAQNVGMVVTHELLLEKVWGPEYHRDIDFIWVYISRLRRKIESDSRHPSYILTVPDVGYKLARF